MQRGGSGVRRLVVPLIALVLSACGGSSSGHSSNSSTLAQAVDGAVQSSMQEFSVPGISVELAKQGSLLYAKGYGEADLASAQPAQTSTVFEIGSITSSSPPP